MKSKKASEKQIIIACIMFGVIIILGCLQIIFSPYAFMRVVNLIAVVGCSISVGAFIREYFVSRQSRKTNGE